MKVTKEQVPVTKSFLIKSLVAIIAFILMTMLPLTYKIGGMMDAYEGLSEIPASDIKKAVTYSVDEQGERKDFYRGYMTKNDLKNQFQDSRLLVLERDMNKVAKDIEKIKDVLVSIEDKIK